jgi:hypothetical protein
MIIGNSWVNQAFPSKKRAVKILREVSGIVKPSRYWIFAKTLTLLKEYMIEKSSSQNIIMVFTSLINLLGYLQNDTTSRTSWSWQNNIVAGPCWEDEQGSQGV